jgi:hypothetical protein
VTNGHGDDLNALGRQYLVGTPCRIPMRRSHYDLPDSEFEGPLLGYLKRGTAIVLSAFAEKQRCDFHLDLSILLMPVENLSPWRLLQNLVYRIP